MSSQAPAKRASSLAKGSKWFALLLALCLCVVLVLFLLTRPTWLELAHWSAPGADHHLIVLEGERNWSGFPLFVTRNHYLYLGRDAQNPSYGHRLPYAFQSPHGAPTPEYLRQVQVTWSDAGVELLEPSGHRLFVPRSAYAGGR